MKIFVDLLWGYHVLLLIFLTGIKITMDTKFFQVRKFFTWMRAALKPGSNCESGGISGFQALTTALAGSLGTGNIVGVGLAIAVGGAGAIFWMWVSAFFGMMTVFAEVVLASKYKKDGETPGAFAYIKKLGRAMPFIYGIGCVLSSLAMGNMAQAKSVAAAISTIGIPPWATGIALCIILFILTSRGIKTISKVTEKLVPFMTLVFFGFSIAALWKFRANIPLAINEIIDGAFSIKGGLGGAMFLAIKTGISRGVFTNEAGLGTSAMAFSAVKGKTPTELGCLGIFQVFIDTIVMCTITGLCILCCTNERSGDFLVRIAFKAALGNGGSVGINICMALFAFATMTATCYYGKVGLSYISKGKLTKYFPYMFGIAAFVGCVIPLTNVFELCDAFNGLMAIPNLAAIFFVWKRSKIL